MVVAKSVLYSQSCAAVQVQYYPCTDWDIQALHSFAPINLAYRFAVMPDLELLCRSLLLMRTKYPKCLGSVVSVNDVYYIKTPSNDTCIRALEVSDNALGSRQEWQAVLDHFPLREGELAGPRLFQVCFATAQGCLFHKPSTQVPSNNPLITWYLLPHLSKQHL